MLVVVLVYKAASLHVWNPNDKRSSSYGGSVSEKQNKKRVSKQKCESSVILWGMTGRVSSLSLHCSAFSLSGYFRTLSKRKLRCPWWHHVGPRVRGEDVLTEEAPGTDKGNYSGELSSSTLLILECSASVHWERAGCAPPTLLSWRNG